MKRSNFNLLDPFELRGIWWDESQPDTEVPGILSYVPGKSIRLELIGSLDTHRQRLSNLDHSPNAIHGFSESGKLITLLQAHRTNQTERFGGISTDAYNCYRLLIGAHFSCEDQVLFSRMYLDLYGLKEWFNQHAFDVEIRHKANPYSLLDYKLTYVSKKSKKYYLRKEKTWVSIERNFSERNDRISELELESQVYLKIDPRGGKSLNWFKGMATTLERLFSTLIGDPIYPIALTAVIENLDADSGKTTHNIVNILYIRSTTVTFRELSWRDALVPFRAIDSQLKNILNMWIQRAGTLVETHNLFFGAIYNSHLYLESVFLAQMQAIESYHRSKQSDHYVSTDLYDAIARDIISAIPAHTPSDLRESLKNRIRFGNQFSLRKRLALIFKDLGPSLATIIAADTNVFITRIIDTRNYLTHLDEQTRGAAIPRDDLHSANFRLRILIVILLLRDAAVADSTIIECIQNNHRIKNMLRMFTI